MESKKPERKPDSEAPIGKTPAEDRVEGLTSPEAPDAPEPGQASQRLQAKKRAAAGGSKSGRPVLTEKQRIEARHKRRQTRKRAPVSGNVLSGGIRATVNEVKRTFSFLGRAVLGGLDRLRPLGGIIVTGLHGLVRATGRGLGRVASLVAAALRVIGRVLLALDRVVTARRGLIAIALSGGVLLVVSQFLDFKAIEIGQPGYVDVQEITRAPRLEAETPIDSHSLLLVVAGVLAAAAAAAAALSRKRVAGLTLVLAGAVALIVALAIDLPAGLDTADAELAFSGVKGVLLSGFWLELGAGFVLLVSGVGLVLDSPAHKKVRNRQRRPVNTPAAGSRA